MFVCPICYREVKQPDAAFCPWCGSTLPAGPARLEATEQEPVTETLPEEVPETVPAPSTTPWRVPEARIELPPTITAAAPPPAPASVPRTVAPEAHAAREAVSDRIRLVALLALAGGAVAAAAAFLTWFRIRIDGFAAPGSAEIGWDDSGGKAVVAAGAVAIVAGLALLIGRRDVWLKMALLVAGGSSLIIAVVNMADARSKAVDIHAEFGIPEADVTAQVGDGLYLTAAAGVALMAAGLLAKPERTGA